MGPATPKRLLAGNGIPIRSSAHKGRRGLPEKLGCGMESLDGDFRQIAELGKVFSFLISFVHSAHGVIEDIDAAPIQLGKDTLQKRGYRIDDVVNGCFFRDADLEIQFVPTKVKQGGGNRPALLLRLRRNKGYVILNPRPLQYIAFCINPPGKDDAHQIYQPTGRLNPPGIGGIKKEQDPGVIMEQEADVFKGLDLGVMASEGNVVMMVFVGMDLGARQRDPIPP
jgi:hypothetical protein